jgi:uncharacterized protein (DUF1330 family)
MDTEYLEVKETELSNLMELAKVHKNEIYMINMLKYNGNAYYYKNLTKSMMTTGEEAYAKYIQKMSPVFNKIGVKLLFSANLMSVLIGPTNKSWDEVLIVRYPSIKVFIEMVTSDEYKKASYHRLAGLEDSRLYLVSTDLKPKF